MNDERPSHLNSSSPKGRASTRGRGDTIVAVATIVGRSAVAVVRLSGHDAGEIGRRCVRPWPTTARTMTRCAVHDPVTGQHLDDGLVVEFPAPASYTGETVVELHCHGGFSVPAAVESALIRAGARPALAGEFTERAVLNGKIDLVTAEAIGELIDARTRAMHRAAIQSLSGTLVRQYAELRSEVIAAEALLAFDIDFPEEDHGPIGREQVERAVVKVEARIATLLATAPAAILGRDGALVVLAGPTNAGKSSLLNAMVGEARVIVSDEPGTTRDAVEVLLDTDPWPIRLVDTAGLRGDAGVVERLGIAVSERYLGGADIVVVCAESPEEIARITTRVRALGDAAIVEVLTKNDLWTPATAGIHGAALSVSAVTGHGLSALRDTILAIVAAKVGRPDDQGPLVTSARQRAALETARDELAGFRLAWREGVLPTPVVATHLRATIHALDHLIGAVDPDEVLARVFSTFCVGK